MSSSETTWGVGEYPLMARQLEPAAAAAVDVAAVLAGERASTSPPEQATPHW